MSFLKKELFDFYSTMNLKSYDLNERMRYQLAMLDGLDAFTRRHSENVATITCNLCQYLKLDEGFTIYCTICAYLHDIGKIFIPPSILQKTSRLTDEEFEVMKTHTTIGYNMCMKDLQLRPYHAGAYYHHEGLDGSGYPNGISGKEIPYEAQIIRVADEFEAITAKRQYKSHVGIVDALNIIIEHAKPSPHHNVGKVDKKIVKALIKVVIDDTEYEISARTDYLNYLKSEIKRMQEANKFYKKMVEAKSDEKRDYFKQYTEVYLQRTETVDECPAILEELQEAYKTRKTQIENLYKEVKKIKKLSV